MHDSRVGIGGQHWQVKSAAPWARKVAIRSLLLAGTRPCSFFGPCCPRPARRSASAWEWAQAPPVCPYGYYNYEPYGCAPSGYYGQGYFYNGIFLGVGPWSNWEYGHGWGGHRFDGPRGGRYVFGARGYRTQAGYVEHRGRGPYAARGGHDNADRRDAPRGGACAGSTAASLMPPSHAGPSHCTRPAHNSGFTAANRTVEENTTSRCEILTRGTSHSNEKRRSLEGSAAFRFRTFSTRIKQNTPPADRTE